MAQISYEASRQLGANSNNSNQVQFFSLKNDGDEAIVRFMHDDTSSFDIITAHQIQTANGKFRNVNCIRDPREPLENCPLCNSGVSVKQRFYIHLLCYLKDDYGNIVPQPMVWERSIPYAEKLKGYIDNYGPLSDVICKIVRHGVANDRNTTYDIIPNLNKQIYTDEKYPKIANAFDSYKVLGTVVLDKNFEELDVYVKTGQFPAVNNERAVNNSEQQIPAPTYVPPQTAQPTYYQAQPSVAPQNNPYQTTQQVQRPIRHY